MAIDIFGDATLGLPGTAFIYSDKKAISIGMGLLLEEFVYHNLRPYEVLARFKAHPVVRPYLAGGNSLEYGAHLIPEQGYDRMPDLAADGVLVAGDAACMVDALHREGTNLAMTAGRMAGETTLEAHRQNDFSVDFLRAYRRKLEDSFVLKGPQAISPYDRLPGQHTALHGHLRDFRQRRHAALLQPRTACPSGRWKARLFGLLPRAALLLRRRPGCDEAAARHARLTMTKRKHHPLSPSWRPTCQHVDVDDLIASVKYYVDEDYAHLWIKDRAGSVNNARPSLAWHSAQWASIA